MSNLIRWSVEEDNKLVEAFNFGGYKEAQKQLSHRTVRGIEKRAQKLGLEIRKGWTELEEQILLENYEITNQKEICELLPERTYISIKSKAQIMGLVRIEQWTKEENDLLKRIFGNATENTLLEAFPGKSLNAVKLHAQYIGLNRKRENIQYNGDEPYHYFFDNIDTKEKAYTLGFWVADGSLMYLPDDSRYIVSFSNTEYEYLVLIKNLIRYPNKIYEQTGSHEGQYILNIASKTLATALHDMGFNSSKSYDAFLPKIPEDLYSHFARGLLDGDGCISRKRDGNKYSLHIHFIGTYNLMSELNKKLPIRSNIVKTESIYRVEFAYKKARIIGEWLYKDSEGLRMDRKYQRYLDSLTQTGFYAPVTT
jgi:hypothetical protein